ncbi:MAG: AbrB/MazE/SpoVT family DNA-binding domain-containing protein [Cyanobacteria bacterium]|nr:AbrB/MazE/SpoVT family DNA-binding domain-containing protein [Cyanobacteria bacterium CG_2015-16_32_12]NCQ03588.1 AbrB/MazE/SpoVT family DNA-binding domain-containing protein [Cyanobacteria bacterium CG_2015-09_32_10]NCQ40315.1 AbrB/MazE/SpoVT family DNA-binding domain-containing protein [Cyanobacteria bacterium CG_2015-04_32_10]
MATTYQIKLIRKGTEQTLILPQELNLNTDEVTIRQEDNKLIIELLKQKTLLETLATLEDIDEEFTDIS